MDDNQTFEEPVTPPKSKRIWYFVRIGFALALLAIVFKRVDIAAAGQAILTVNPWIFILSASMFIGIRFIFSMQMTFGLKPLGLPVTSGELFRYQMATTFYALLLPGDLAAGGVFWYKLFRKAKKVYEPMALIIFTRLINTLAMLMIGLVAMWYDSKVATPEIRMMLVVIFCLGTTAFLPLISRRIKNVVHDMGVKINGVGIVPKFISTKIEKLWTALIAFQKMRESGSAYKVIALAFLVHLVGTCWFFLLAQSLELGVSIFVIGWIRVCLALLQFIPITIAGLGVREVSVVYLLGMYGVDEPLALAFSLCIFAVNVTAGLVGWVIEISEGTHQKKYEVVD